MEKKQKIHKNLHYPFRGFRLSDETYNDLKSLKKDVETWNKYFKRIIKSLEKIDNYKIKKNG